MKIAGRNINNLRCAHDTTLMAESKEELKNLLMKTGKAGLKLNIQKTTIIASGPTTSWQNQFSSSVVSNSLWPHGLQHSRPPCPSPTPRVYSNPCPLSWWCLCHPLFLPPSVFPSIRVFSNESALRIRWPKYWRFSFSISPFNEYSGLISFRMDWLYLLAVQGALKSLLQYHNSKTSILGHSAFFTVQLSHPYMTTGKTIALTRWTFVDKVMSLLFNMLSRLVIPSLSRSKRLLISWLQSPSVVILEPMWQIDGETVETVADFILVGSNTLTIWCEDLTQWKRPWCWERLKAGGEEDEMAGWHHRCNGHEFE